MKKVVSAGIVPFYYRNGVREYLMLQHAGEAGHWDFPKGKVEVGEDRHQAALRELAEEAGISVEFVPGFELSFSYCFKDFNDNEPLHIRVINPVYKTVYFYVGRADSTVITLSHEHQDYAWLSYAQAREKLTYDNAKKLLDDVEEFLEKGIKE